MFSLASRWSYATHDLGLFQSFGLHLQMLSSTSSSAIKSVKSRMYASLVHICKCCELCHISLIQCITNIQICVTQRSAFMFPPPTITNVNVYVSSSNHQHRSAFPSLSSTSTSSIYVESVMNPVKFNSCQSLAIFPIKSPSASCSPHR